MYRPKYLAIGRSHSTSAFGMKNNLRVIEKHFILVIDQVHHC